jgi:hypothetical protein
VEGFENRFLLLTHLVMGHFAVIIIEMKNTLRFLLVLAVLWAPDTYARKAKFLWSDIQLGATRVKPNGPGWSSGVTVQAAWTPILDLDLNDVFLRGELGFSWPYDNGGYRFLSVNYQAFVMVPVYSLLMVEGGAGMQYWKNAGGITHPIVSFNFVLRVAEFVDRVYFGYSRYFLAGRGVDQFSSGVAFNLF